jgi:hypothetical protein
MVARGKVVVAKWGVPSKEPEDVPDFLSNEEISEKMGGDPKGVYRLKLKKLTVVKNKNNDDMIKIVCEIFETDKEKKGYNGWAFWTQENVTEESAGYLKTFLRSFGASWADFNLRTKVTPETKTEPAQIVSIGKVNFTGAKPVLVRATVGMGRAQNGSEAQAEVKRWLPPADADAGAEDIEDGDEELLDDEDLGEDEVEEVEDGELEEGDEEEAELREELEALTIVDLRKRVKTNDADYKTVGLKKPALIDVIVEQELLLDDEEEPEEELAEDEDDGGEAELREELEALTIGALKQRAKANGEKVVVLKPIKDKAEVIDIIVTQELLGDDDEDGEEPPF